MSRCGLMELIFQCALPVGSGVGSTSPMWSLESIRGPNNGEPLGVWEKFIGDALSLSGVILGVV